jgi:hypothetical protein
MRSDLAASVLSRGSSVYTDRGKTIIQSIGMPFHPLYLLTFDTEFLSFRDCFEELPPAFCYSSMIELSGIFVTFSAVR